MTRLFDLPHHEAAALARSGAPVYLPVNPVEFHGPHLSLHNDRLVSHALAEAMHARYAARHGDGPMLVADDLEIGVDPCPGPGSRHTPFVVAVSLVREAVRALVELGATRIVLSTFHGAPLHAAALEEGVKLGQALGARVFCPFNLVTRELTAGGDPNRFAHAVAHLGDADRERVLRALPFDFHAGFFETSLALWAAPDSVSEIRATLPPTPVPEPSRGMHLAARVSAALGGDALSQDLGFASVGVAWQALRPFPGYTSAPHLADARAGRAFADDIVAIYDREIDAVLHGDAPSPPPILAWLKWATLGGIVPSAPSPTMDEIAVHGRW